MDDIVYIGTSIATLHFTILLYTEIPDPSLTATTTAMLRTALISVTCVLVMMSALLD